jgi:UbiD family decarboxylase
VHAPEQNGKGDHDVDSLREWLDKVEAMGELVRVTEPVDWDEEAGAISYMAGKTSGNPAVLFENIRGHSPDAGQLLFNSLESPSRVALTVGEDPAGSVLDIIRGVKDKLKNRIPPVTVAPESAPIYENVLTGDDIDLTALPTPKHWPLDGGRYLGTADAVITQDPDSGYTNVGTYRMMVHDEKHIGLYLSPGKDARLHIARAWKRNEPLRVAAVMGGDPSVFMMGTLALPHDVSEYEYIGGLKGRPLEVVPGATSGLLVPAHSELVVEGLIHPGAPRMEGPFGEFTGYYGRPEATAPLVEVTGIMRRDRPIIMNALMSDNPLTYSAIARSAGVWNDLETMGVPGIKGVWHPSPSRGLVVISIEQQYAGHAAQVLALAAQSASGAYFAKWFVVVDHDVDPTDNVQVQWAMGTRCNPTEDIDILRQTWSSWLDPTQNPPDERPYGSKALINACMEHRYLPVFSRRTKMRRSMYDQVRGRWSELGLPGTPPQVFAFEDDDDAADSAMHESRGVESTK